jgi:LPXTG-motif cell wall-anchored protein
MRRRLIAAVAAVALLAAPAGALAQSAGDEQYTDPFGDVDEPTQDQGTTNESPAPAADPAGQAPAAGSAAGSVAAADPGSEGALPQTGFPAALSALFGALLVAAGVSIRRRAQPPVALPPWLVPAGSHRGRFGGRRRFRR